MNIVKEGTKVINDVFKMVDEEPIPAPTDGTSLQKLEILFDIYTTKLIEINPQYKNFR